MGIHTQCLCIVFLEATLFTGWFFSGLHWIMNIASGYVAQNIDIMSGMLNLHITLMSYAIDGHTNMPIYCVSGGYSFCCILGVQLVDYFLHSIEYRTLPPDLLPKILILWWGYWVGLILLRLTPRWSSYWLIVISFPRLVSILCDLLLDKVEVEARCSAHGLDSGSTDENRYYIVMPYGGGVRGVSTDQIQLKHRPIIS